MKMSTLIFSKHLLFPRCCISIWNTVLVIQTFKLYTVFVTLWRFWENDGSQEGRKKAKGASWLFVWVKGYNDICTENKFNKYTVSIAIIPFSPVNYISHLQHYFSYLKQNTETNISFSLTALMLGDKERKITVKYRQKQYMIFHLALSFYTALYRLWKTFFTKR